MMKKGRHTSSDYRSDMGRQSIAETDTHSRLRWVDARRDASRHVIHVKFVTDQSHLQGNPSPTSSFVELRPVTKVDLTGLIARDPQYTSLKSAKTFAAAELDDGGTLVSWRLPGIGGSVELPSAKLHWIGMMQQPIDTSLLRLWQSQFSLSNQDVAALLGIDLRSWTDYCDGAPIPKLLQIAIRAMMNPTTVEANFIPAIARSARRRTLDAPTADMGRSSDRDITREEQTMEGDTVASNSIDGRTLELRPTGDAKTRNTDEN